MKKNFILFLTLLTVMYTSSAQMPNEYSQCPNNLSQLAVILDEEFPDIVISDFQSVDNFINANIHSKLGNRIASLVSPKNNPTFWDNTNPSDYSVHKELIRSIILEWYWYNKQGVSFDIEITLECQDRISKSSELPQTMPAPDLVRDNNFSSVPYRYKGRYCTEYVYRYVSQQNGDIYLYSFHYGWFVLTEKQHQNMIDSGDYENQLWNLLQTNIIVQ